MAKKKNKYETKYLVSRGIKKAEAEALLERMHNGIFERGDVLYIPNMTIIDSDPYTKEYGRVHDLKDHLFMVVDIKEMNFFKQDSDYLCSAKSNVQLALIDGVHDKSDYFRMAKNEGSIFLPKGRTGMGSKDSFFIHCDRLVLASSDILLNHEANLTAVIKDPFILDRAKLLSFSKGIEKINDLNLEWIKETKLNVNSSAKKSKRKTYGNRTHRNKYKER